MATVVQESALNLSNSDSDAANSSTSSSTKEESTSTSASEAATSLLRSHSIDAILGLRRQQEQAGKQILSHHQSQAFSQFQRHLAQSHQNNNAAFLQQQHQKLLGKQHIECKIPTWKVVGNLA